MTLLRRLMDSASRLFGRRSDTDIDVELQEHLRLLGERYLRQGMTPDAAMRAARQQFGNVTLIREDRELMQRIPVLESLARDLRHSARSLRKSPSFAAAVILTLGVGIGATTAVFSIFNAVLLKPLPYAAPDRLVMLWERMGPNNTLITVAPANFHDWREQLRSFATVAALNPNGSFVLSGSGEPVRLVGASVSWDFFAMLGTQPIIGRTFVADEGQTGGNRVAMLSYATWVDRFGARPDIAGSTVTFNDTSYTIVGVLPRDFELVGRPSDNGARSRFDVFVPYVLGDRPSRGTHPLRVFARLATGATIEQAQSELDILGRELERLYPSDNRDKGITAVPLHAYSTSGTRGQLFLLLGVVGFVLAIACANVANLMLSRTATRRQETAVRLAIGASRGRVAQQLLVETLLLGSTGGAVGLGLALLAIRVAIPSLPADLSRTASIDLDWRVLTFTAAASLATSVLFGLAPLFQLRRLQASESLTPGLRVAGGQSALRSVLVVTQVAVTLVLLVGAGLMARSLWQLLHVPLGFQVDHVLTARMTLPRTRYPTAASVAAFHDRVLERLRTSPGVVAAGSTAYLPLSGDDNGWAFRIDGRPPLPTGVFIAAKYRAVSDGYFEAIGMPIVRGRDISLSDDQDAPYVVVINEAMARQFWRDEDPVGQRLFFGNPHPRTIIGIVGDVRHEGLAGEPSAEMYVPLAQAPNVEGAARLVVRMAQTSPQRASVEPTALTATVRTIVANADPGVPLDIVRTMNEMVAAASGQPRFRAILLTALSALALVIAIVGVYGVTSYAVVQRTRELGICLAVGAAPRDVLRLVLRRSLLLIAIGIVSGLLAAAALTRLMSDLLYGVTPLDAPTFAGVTVLLFIVAFAASYLPARRATRIDPVSALRCE
jgi:putative ABC transport system permease protein